MMARRRRNRGMRTQTKVVIAATVLATAGLTTYVVVRRRRHFPTLPPPPQGANAPGPNYFAAKRRFCTAPDLLSGDQRQALIDVVFAPRVLKYTASLPAQPGPDQLESALAAAAVDGINALCKEAPVGSPQIAYTLANAAWLQQTGMSGQ